MSPRASAAPRRVEAVFFDLGGTLLDYLDADRWSNEAAEVGLTVEPEHLAHALADTQESFDRPGRDPDLEAGPVFWGAVFEAATGTPVAPAMVGRFVERWRNGHRDGRLYSDVPRCLEELRREGRRLGVISNCRSEEWLHGAVTAAGLARRFEVLVSSGTEHVAKPDRAIFDRAARRMGVANAVAFHVGDLAYTDARAAAAAGFRSVWLHRRGTGFGTDPPEITSLTELPGYLRELEGAPVK